jgi:two-component system chemotaxis response regulator CheB
MSEHRIIVVGASAGGVEALSRLAASLMNEIPAAIFVSMHISGKVRSYLPDILNRHGPLPAKHPQDGEVFQAGHLYIAPPDRHLLLEPGRIRLLHGPKENGFRPAIDPLFRSAARAYGAHVIGVILSGSLDDGTAGLQDIKSHGGVAIVQDPQDCLYDGMARSAIENVSVDYILPISAIGPKLACLAEEPTQQGGITMQIEERLRDSEIVQNDRDDQELGKRSGEPSIFTCPECGGVLWEMDEGDVIRFRCHVGHRYSAESMFSAQGEMLEAALWTAVRALEESVSLSHRMTTRMKRAGQHGSAERFERQAREASQRADLIRKVLQAEKETDGTEDAIQPATIATQ